MRAYAMHGGEVGGWPIGSAICTPVAIICPYVNPHVHCVQHLGGKAVAVTPCASSRTPRCRFRSEHFDDVHFRRALPQPVRRCRCTFPLPLPHCRCFCLHHQGLQGIVCIYKSPVHRLARHGDCWRDRDVPPIPTRAINPHKRFSRKKKTQNRTTYTHKMSLQLNKHLQTNKVQSNKKSILAEFN